VQAEISALFHERVKEGKLLIPVILGDGVQLPPLIKPLARLACPPGQCLPSGALDLRIETSLKSRQHDAVSGAPIDAIDRGLVRLDRHRAGTRASLWQGRAQRNCPSCLRSVLRARLAYPLLAGPRSRGSVPDAASGVMKKNHMNVILPMIVTGAYANVSAR
jgi:hypothetical protein